MDNDPLRDRMEALVRAIADRSDLASGDHHYARHLAEARAIVAELPEPVDPDLIEARRLAADISGYRLGPNVCGRYLEGHYDQCYAVLNALAGIKRGRELQKASA